MHISELAACKNTAKLNSTLNPVVWDRREHLKTAVRDQILAATEEYCVFLGLTESQVNDIVVSGDMASFKYSDQSAVDVVVIADLDPDPTFREFFNENKYKYNGQQQVKVNGHLVQFYVQPADQQFITNGSYSVLRESWVQIPRRQLVEDTVSTLRALDQAARPRLSHKKKKKLVQEAIIVQYGFGSDFLDEVGVTPDGVSASTCMFANEEELNEVGVTPDGVSASTCQFANEGEAAGKEEIVQDFVQFCADQLGLEREPDLRIRRDPEWSKRAKTFGRYNPGTNQLEVSLSNRHVMDILRTVAHELTHQHQHEREDVPDHAGETGSEWENEANARAGILMRDYGQANPHLFDAADELDEGWKNWAAAGLATAAMAGAAQPAQAQSVQQGLGAIQNIGTAVNTFRGVDWNTMLRSEAGTALYNFILANGGNPNSQNQSSLYQWQKQMQQNQSAQPGQPAQAQQYTQQAAPASPTTSMYGDILKQQQARASTNESSGYIPTAAQADDPRFEMALTADVRPGATGKNANKLQLNTDAQGHPQLLRADGMVQRMMAEYLEFKK